MKKLLAALIAALMLALAAEPALAMTAPPVVHDAADLNEALNIPGGALEFTSTGDYPWLVAGDAAMSGNGGVPSSSSALRTTVTANEGDIIRFEYKAWGEGVGTPWDKCQFYIDGSTVFSYGAVANSDWIAYVGELSAGTHNLVWLYAKDGDTDPPGDYFMVDNVYVGPVLQPESIIAADVTVAANLSAQIEYEVQPFAALNKSVTFASADESIATVDASGRVRGISEGSTSVTITSEEAPQVTATIGVTVTEAVPVVEFEAHYPGTREWVRFVDLQPDMLTPVGTLREMSFAAAYMGGSVYGYLGTGNERDFYIMDAEDHSVRYPGGDSFNVGLVYAMAYNYANETMYALVGPDGPRSLATVNLESGEITIVAEVTGLPENKLAMTLAIDGDGNAYTLDMNSTSSNLYRLDLESAEATPIGATGVPLQYVQAMTWDHGTGRLFWAQYATATGGGLYEIDPATAETQYLGAFPEGMPELTALFTRSEPGDEPPAGIIGDVDGDGSVTAADAVLALRCALGIATLSDDALERMDVDGDGAYTAGDAVLILRISLGVA